MPRVVRCGLIQASNVKSPAEASLAEIREAMIEKHLAMIDEAARRGRADPLPAGAVLRAVLRGRAGPALVRVHRARARRPDREAHAGAWRRSTRWRWWCRSTRRRRPASTTTPPPCSTPTARYLGKYRKNHIPHCLPAFWEKFYFKPGQPRLSRSSRRATRPSASTSATTATSRRAAALLGLHGAEIVFVPSATTTGHSDNLWKIEQTRDGHRQRLLRRAPTTAWAARRPGTSASSTARPTSATPTARSWPRAAATRTSWWWPTSTST